MNTNDFTNYAKRFASLLGPALEQVLTLIILVEKDLVPWWGWPVLASALLYFLNPFDALPDPIFVDDIGVLAGAIATLHTAITDSVRQEARRRANEILGIN